LLAFPLEFVADKQKDAQNSPYEKRKPVYERDAEKSRFYPIYKKYAREHD